ncbi:MAG: RluA family pseudouridine synthase, partial [Clostridia bacterium]|nr:RluA family pseudouridine synthase [Clostridia bacterium]
MIDAIIYVVEEKYNNERIDKVLSLIRPEVTRSFIQKILQQGDVKVNGTAVSKSYKVKTGDKIFASSVTPRELEAVPQDIPLDIRYEDDCLLVVNKPKGMVVHPAAGNYENTLVNAVLYHCGDSLSGIGGVLRPGILHRIDKDTSGLLLVAKNDDAHNVLASQIKEHSLTREYEAVVYGNIKSDDGVVDAPIGRHPVKRKQMAVTNRNSKNAV